MSQTYFTVNLKKIPWFPPNLGKGEIMGKWHGPEEKLKLIQAIQTSGKSIGEACQEAGISRVSYYNWVKRAPNLELEELANKSRCPRKLQFIAGEIETAIVEAKMMYPHMGCKQLSNWLKRFRNVWVNPRTVLRVLERNEVHNLYLKRPKHDPRRFERSLPDELWQMDIMYFYIAPKKCYLIPIIDDFSRFIVSYAVTDVQTSEAVLDVLKRGLAFRKPRAILTDQGIQFTNWHSTTPFERCLQAKGIEHILASPQHPETLGKLESFHRNLQRELINTYDFRDLDEAKQLISRYIVHYNFARPHMGINHFTPAERYFANVLDYHPCHWYNLLQNHTSGGGNGEKTRPAFSESRSAQLQASGEKVSSSEERECPAQNGECPISKSSEVLEKGNPASSQGEISRP